MITAVEESDGQDSSVVQRPIVIMSINDTIGTATVRRPLKRQGLEGKYQIIIPDVSSPIQESSLAW